MIVWISIAKGEVGWRGEVFRGGGCVFCVY